MKHPFLVAALVVAFLYYWQRSQTAATPGTTGLPAPSLTPSTAVTPTPTPAPNSTPVVVTHPLATTPGVPVVSVRAADASEQPQNEINLYNSVVDRRYSPTSPEFFGNGSNVNADVESAFAGAGGTGYRALNPIDLGTIFGGSFPSPFNISSIPSPIYTGGHGVK